MQLALWWHYSLPMRHIAPHHLWIGNRGDLDDAGSLRIKGVEAVVDLAIEEKAFEWGHEGIVLRVPLEDGGGNDAASLRLAVASVVNLLRGGVPTLVVCSAGISRSPAVTAFALAEVEGRDPVEALREIARAGHADVSPVLWGALRQMGDGEERR